MSNTKKIFSILTLLFVSIFLLAGCGQSAKEGSNKDQQVFDNYGTTVTVEGVPDKILTLGPNITELMVALGLEDKIVGTSLNNHSRGPLPEYADKINKLKEINHAEATSEAVKTSGANFIYGIDWEFGGEALNREELKDFGITTYANSAKTLEEQYQEIRDMGKIFHIEDRAEAFIKDQQNRIEKVEKEVGDEKKKKILIYDSGNNGVFTASGKNFTEVLLNKAGGENIFADLKDKEWITVSYEEILKRNPDIILILDYDSPSVESKIKDIKANPVLSQLDAVKNNRFATISLESMLPGSRMAYTVEKLAKAFHPDKIK